MQGIEEIAALLHVYEKASAHGTQLSNIANEALTELRQINADKARMSDLPPHSLPGEPPRQAPPPGAEVPKAEEPSGEPSSSVGSVTVGGQNVA